MRVSLIRGILQGILSESADFDRKRVCFRQHLQRFRGGFPKRRNREFEMPNREFSGTDQGDLDLKQGSGGLDKSEKPLLGLPVHWQFASGDSFERKFCRLRPREDGLLDSG